MGELQIHEHFLPAVNKWFVKHLHTASSDTESEGPGEIELRKMALLAQ
jgi:hypothetical protein